MLTLNNFKLLAILGGYGVATSLSSEHAASRSPGGFLQPAKSAEFSLSSTSLTSELISITPSSSLSSVSTIPTTISTSVSSSISKTTAAVATAPVPAPAPLTNQGKPSAPFIGLQVDKSTELLLVAPKSSSKTLVPPSIAAQVSNPIVTPVSTDASKSSSAEQPESTTSTSRPTTTFSSAHPNYLSAGGIRTFAGGVQVDKSTESALVVTTAVAIAAQTPSSDTTRLSGVEDKTHIQAHPDKTVQASLDVPSAPSTALDVLSSQPTSTKAADIVSAVLGAILTPLVLSQGHWLPQQPTDKNTESALLPVTTHKVSAEPLLGTISAGVTQTTGQHTVSTGLALPVPFIGSILLTGLIPAIQATHTTSASIAQSQTIGQSQKTPNSGQVPAQQPSANGQPNGISVVSGSSGPLLPPQSSPAPTGTMAYTQIPADTKQPLASAFPGAGGPSNTGKQATSASAPNQISSGSQLPSEASPNYQASRTTLRTATSSAGSAAGSIAVTKPLTASGSSSTAQSIASQIAAGAPGLFSGAGVSGIDNGLGVYLWCCVFFGLFLPNVFG